MEQGHFARGPCRTRGLPRAECFRQLPSRPSDGLDQTRRKHVHRGSCNKRHRDRRKEMNAIPLSATGQQVKLLIP